MRHGRSLLTALLLGGANLPSLSLAADMLRPSFPVTYAERVPLPAEAHPFTVGVAFGVSNIEGRETLHHGAHKNSELIWETDNAPTISITLEGRALGGLETRLRGTFAIQTDSYMEDYDWAGNFPSFQLNTYEWTHRSQHKATTLDRSINLDAQVGKRVFGSDRVGLSIIGGVRHTDVQWTAYGGDFVYSTPIDRTTGAPARFRDNVFSIPDTEKGVTYQQRYTSPYLGLGAGVDAGRFSLQGAGYIGVPLITAGTDDHWHRFFRANNSFDDTYMLGFEAEAGFDITHRLDVTASLRHEQYGEGGSSVYATSHHGLGYDRYEGHTGGGQHRQTNVGLGASYSF